MLCSGLLGSIRRLPCLDFAIKQDFSSAFARRSLRGLRKDSAGWSFVPSTEAATNSASAARPGYEMGEHTTIQQAAYLWMAQLLLLLLFVIVHQPPEVFFIQIGQHSSTYW